MLDPTGDFGLYQITVVIFAALRAMCCAMDGLSGPFLTPNIKNFQCEICETSFSQYPTTSNTTTSDALCSLYLGSQVQTRYDIDPSQCYFNNADSLRPDKIQCKKWSFNNTDNERYMQSLTIEQSLVCDREWLKSLSNSMYFVGATFGLLFWGIISDRYGRKTAYVCSHFVALVFGFSALFADSMCTYILLRAINAFGMIGELIPRSIQVEIVATEYRFVCSVICQIGWATGIILVPALAYYNPSYRFILAFPVVVTVLMVPWLFYLPESARWLIANKNYTKARNELRRAARINGKLTDDIDLKIEQFNRQVLREEIDTKDPGKRMGIWRSILAIFTNIHLLKDTMSVFVLLFAAEVVYFSLTLNVADLGGSLYINYVISGLSELVSIAFCGIILAYLSRRTCLSLLLLASTVSYLLMALVNVYEESLSMPLILTVNAFGKLTAIGNLMVIILVSQEVFPTVIRQFGTSLCITVGKAGSAVAPFTHELGQVIGQSYCFAMFSLICLLCALIPFGLSETGNRELPDTVIDVEEGASGQRGKKEKKIKPGPASHVANYQSHTPSFRRLDADELDTIKGLGGHRNINGKLADKNSVDLAMLGLPWNHQHTKMIEDMNNNSIDDSNFDKSDLANRYETHVRGLNQSNQRTDSPMSHLSSNDISETNSGVGSRSDVSSTDKEIKTERR